MKEQTVLPDAMQESAEAPRSDAISIDARKFDRLMNLSGELVSLRTQFARLVQLLENDVAVASLKGDIAQRAQAFDELTGMLGKVSSDIQASVMESRLVTIEDILEHCRAEAMKKAKVCNKEVSIVLAGVDTELDKRLADLLRDPLVSLAQLAIAQGIEDAGVRKKQEKPACGTLTFKAMHRGNAICVEIQDDGCGLDSEAIVPVQPMIDRVNGLLSLDSKQGEGTTMQIEIPLTLSIIHALLVIIAEQTYAIPIESVTEIIKVLPDDVYSIDGNEAVKLRGHALSLVDLRSVIGIRGEQLHTDEARKVIVITNGEEQIGIIVDTLIGEDEIVVKTLSEHFSHVEGIAGASILGDGSVAVILDAPKIMAVAQ